MPREERARVVQTALKTGHGANLAQSIYSPAPILMPEKFDITFSNSSSSKKKSVRELLVELEALESIDPSVLSKDDFTKHKDQEIQKLDDISAKIDAWHKDIVGKKSLDKLSSSKRNEATHLQDMKNAAISSATRTLENRTPAEVPEGQKARSDILSDRFTSMAEVLKIAYKKTPPKDHFYQDAPNPYMLELYRAITAYGDNLINDRADGTEHLKNLLLNLQRIQSLGELYISSVREIAETNVGNKDLARRIAGAADLEARRLSAQLGDQAPAEQESEGAPAIRDNLFNPAVFERYFRGALVISKIGPFQASLNSYIALLVQYNSVDASKPDGPKRKKELLLRIYNKCTAWLAKHDGDGDNDYVFASVAVKALGERAKSAYLKMFDSQEQDQAQQTLSENDATSTAGLLKRYHIPLEGSSNLPSGGLFATLIGKQKSTTPICDALDHYGSVFATMQILDTTGQSEKLANNLRLTHQKRLTVALSKIINACKTYLDQAATDKKAKPEVSGYIGTLQQDALKLHTQSLALETGYAASAKSSTDSSGKGSESLSEQEAAAKDQLSENQSAFHPVSHVLITSEQFEKLTSKFGATRGANIKAIQAGLKKYDAFRARASLTPEEQEKAKDTLGVIYDNCNTWMRLHAGESKGSICYRRPVIQSMLGEEGSIYREGVSVLGQAFNSNQGLTDSFVTSITPVSLSDSVVKLSSSGGNAPGFANKDLTLGVKAAVALKISVLTALSVEVAVTYTHSTKRKTDVLDSTKNLNSEDNLYSKSQANNRFNLTLSANGLASLLAASGGVGLGWYATARAKTPADCGKLLSFDTHRMIQSSRLIPQFAANLILGGNTGKKGYENAVSKEAGFASVLAQKIGTRVRPGKSEEITPYVENGMLADEVGEASVAVLGNVRAEGQQRFNRKRITQDTLASALGATVNDTEDKNKEALATAYRTASNVGADGKKMSGKNKVADTNRKINAKRQREKAKSNRVVKSQHKFGANSFETVREYSAGHLRRIRLMDDCPLDQFTTGDNIASGVDHMTTVLHKICALDGFDPLDTDTEGLGQKIQQSLLKDTNMVMLRRLLGEGALRSPLHDLLSKDGTLGYSVEFDMHNGVVRLFFDQDRLDRICRTSAHCMMYELFKMASLKGAIEGGKYVIGKGLNAKVPGKILSGALPNTNFIGKSVAQDIASQVVSILPADALTWIEETLHLDEGIASMISSQLVGALTNAGQLFSVKPSLGAIFSMSHESYRLYSLWNLKTHTPPATP